MAELLGGPPAEPGRVASGSETVLHSLVCPGCAGRLSVREGERIIHCEHCGTGYLLGGSTPYDRRYFPARIDRLQAVGRAAGWLGRAKDAPRGLRGAKFTQAHLLYLPIWEVRAHVVGWEFGIKRRTVREVMEVGEQAVLDLQLVDETVEQGFLDERRLYQEATDLAGLGMGRPHVTGRDLALPYLPGELESSASVLETDRDYTEVLARARETFGRPSVGIEVRDSKIFLLKESVTLLYYPLWSLRYEYRGRLYEVSVDGRNGAIHSARAPADNGRRLAAMLAGYAAIAACLALLVTAWGEWPAAREAALWAGVLLALASGTVYWRFNLVREVEHHETFSS
jgi:hypothetical protein